jgi:hypothetical protein
MGKPTGRSAGAHESKLGDERVSNPGMILGRCLQCGLLAIGMEIRRSNRTPVHRCLLGVEIGSSALINPTSCTSMGANGCNGSATTATGLVAKNRAVCSHRCLDRVRHRYFVAGCHTVPGQNTRVAGGCRSSSLLCNSDLIRHSVFGFCRREVWLSKSRFGPRFFVEDDLFLLCCARCVSFSFHIWGSDLDLRGSNCANAVLRPWKSTK